MKPGRELDKLIAEKVMGWLVGGYPTERGLPPKLAKYGYQSEAEYIPYYSTSIAAAWEVVEASNAMIFELGANIHTKKWMCKFSGGETVSGDTAPHAICLAALKATGEL